jgi:hypothetical protein
MGYPPMTPSPPTSTGPTQATPETLTMSEEDFRAWQGRLELARHARKSRIDRANELLKAYLPPISTNADAINSNVHFRNTQLKLAELWAQLPDLHLTPLEPLQGLADPADPSKPIAPEDVVAVKRALLNKLLGPDGANVDQTIQEALFSVFQTVGVGATKICYEADTQETEISVPGPPTSMPGSVLGLQQVPGAPVTQLVPVVVHERFRWYHFSEAKFLMPHDWHSTDFDAAPWLAMEFVMRLPTATRKFKLPAEFAANATRDELILESDTSEPAGGTSDLVKGVEVWFRRSEFDPAVAHSELFACLTLIDGLDAPAEYRASPYQTLGPDGRLTADSMIGNCIHPLCLRVAGDTAWVPPDSAFTDPLVRQENTWMAQTIKIRDANIPRFLHADSVTEAIEKLKDADVGQGAGVADDKLAAGIDKIIAPLPHLEPSPSDAPGHALLQRAITETLGLGANQAGNYTSTVRSATESAIVQTNVSVRLKGERNVLMRRFLSGVRKFDSLVQRYLDMPGYVEIVGQNGARRLQAYNPHVLAGRYAYDAKIDTQLANDPEKRTKNVTDFVNFMAKSAFMDQQELARLTTAEFGYDPARLVKPPPPPAPEKPNISFRFTGEDLGIPEVRLILAGAGIKLPPIPSPQATQATMEAMAKKAAGATPHGGAADKADVVSKHTSDETGAMPGRTVPGAPGAGPTQPGRVQ